MKKTGLIGLAAIAATPAVVAILRDRDLSSNVHIAVIGVAATAVALCDALFGQIVAITGEMPFRNWGTPAEARQRVMAFDAYHREVFWAWAVAKLSSSMAVMLTAITLAGRGDNLVCKYRMWLLSSGYVALGLSLAAALFFIVSYWNARSAANESRLGEMAREYRDEHFHPKPPTGADLDEEKRQYEAMSKYDSPVSAESSS